MYNVFDALDTKADSLLFFHANSELLHTVVGNQLLYVWLHQKTVTATICIIWLCW
jgi:hypothetical protein